MNWLLVRQLFAASVCLLANPPVSAAGQNCAAMEESGPQWFSTQLDKVEATYQSGNSREAYQQLWVAMMGLPRRADVSLDARCVGPAGWQRMYKLRQAIARTAGKQSENGGKLAHTEGALDWYVLGDNRDDARRVIAQLVATAAGAAFIINRLQNEISLLDRAQESGFELLPEERSARAVWQKDLDGTIAYASERTVEILEKESGLVKRAATSKEQQLEAARDSQQTLVANYLGDESLVVKNEAQREVNRAEGSLIMLASARGWSHAVSADAVAPVLDRAVMRGEALQARAADANLSLEARESLYEAAENYFMFAGNSARQQAVERGRAAIAPALKAERDARTARIDRKGAELKESALQMKESMHKTDVQKKSFKDEADAMEDELGF
jgi:hypothetical protein